MLASTARLHDAGGRSSSVHMIGRCLCCMCKKRAWRSSRGAQHMWRAGRVFRSISSSKQVTWVVQKRSTGCGQRACMLPLFTQAGAEAINRVWATWLHATTLHTGDVERDVERAEAVNRVRADWVITHHFLNSHLLSVCVRSHFLNVCVQSRLKKKGVQWAQTVCILFFYQSD
jgi:hypothetical protein